MANLCEYIVSMIIHVPGSNNNNLSQRSTQKSYKPIVENCFHVRYIKTGLQ